MTDESKRTKIFDWDVPMTVGGQEAKAVGTLEWVPSSSSGTSPLLFVGIAAAVLAIGAGASLSCGAGGEAPLAPAGEASPRGGLVSRIRTALVPPR